MDTTSQIMKIYGYPRDQEELQSPLAMAEVSFVADASTLRELARFFIHVADAMDMNGEQFGHEHFSDFIEHRTKGSPDVIISR